MDAHVVVGVGNIYASEALFKAGIRPTTRARRLSRARLDPLARQIKQVPRASIRAGRPAPPASGRETLVGRWP